MLKNTVATPETGHCDGGRIVPAWSGDGMGLEGGGGSPGLNRNIE